MDYKDRKNKEHLITFKGDIIQQLDSFLMEGVESSNRKDYKRSALLCYWLKDYLYYLNFEKTFTPKKMKKYKRGEILKVNFGFNVGSEHGGLHYAVVVDNNNSVNSGVITVVPLKSKDPDKDVFYKDVDLGPGIYEKMQLKLSTVQKSVRDELETASDYFEKLEEMGKTLNDTSNGLLDQEKLHEYEQSLRDIDSKIQRLNETDKLAADMQKEIGKMKKGSVAIVEQITTVSKMRIFDPKTSRDVLSGIRLSDSELDEIDNKIMELFLKHKSIE